MWKIRPLLCIGCVEKDAWHFALSSLDEKHDSWVIINHHETFIRVEKAKGHVCGHLGQSAYLSTNEERALLEPILTRAIDLAYSECV